MAEDDPFESLCLINGTTMKIGKGGLRTFKKVKNYIDENLGQRKK